MHSQPVGPDLEGWTPPGPPPPRPLHGSHVALFPLEPVRDAPALHRELRDAPDSLWTYMGFGPFPDAGSLEATLQRMVDLPDRLPYVIVHGGRAVGFASYLRIMPDDGVIEVGSIVLSPEIQRSTAATEALYLIIGNVFELGYRRCEWKCDHLHAASRAAAERLGFSYEGTFRKATHYKGRSRDTAWYAIVDSDWPRIDEGFRRWLAPGNFDEHGHQIRRLSEMREKG